MNVDGSKLVRALLNPESRAPSCRFRVWQPYHSGKGRDVWSIDDFYIGPQLANSLSFNESLPDSSIFIGDPSKGSFCNRDDVIVIQPDVTNEVKILKCLFILIFFLYR